jgi:2Fe-2S ferredoxin
MVKVIFVEHAGSIHTLDGDEGCSLMEIAVNGGVPGIIADCGGALSCATCHVFVRSEWFEKIDPRSDEETAMLEMAIDPSDTSRLSCCIKLSAALDGLVVDIPPSQV